MIGGSDEHGVPITLRAKKEGVTPQDVVDRFHGIIKKSFEEFGISFDIYSRTTSPTHRQVASDFFRTLYEKGEFVEKTSEQYYDEEAKQFLADRYITGTCPHCGNEKAYGDQCEACGTSLNATDLINPKSAISGSEPVMKETKHWYLPLDKHEPFLRKWILEDHMETERVRTVQELAGHGIATACRKPRPGLGYPCSGGRSGRQSALRMVRCADRLYFQYKRITSRQLGDLVERS